MDASLIATGEIGFLDGLLMVFKNASDVAMLNLFPHAIWLAVTLGILEITAVWALYDGTARVTDMLSKFIKIAFFVAIIQFWPAITNQYVLPSFVKAGAVASGVDKSFADGKPSTVIEHGFTITKRLWNHINYDISPTDKDVYNDDGTLNDTDLQEKIKDYEKGNKGIFNISFDLSKIIQKFMEMICSVLIIGSFAWIAFQVLMAYIEFYILAGLGIFFIPFGVNKHTAFLSNKVIGAVVNFGIKLMVLIFMCGIINKVVLDIATIRSTEPKVLFSAAMIIILLAVLVTMIPQLISGMLSGSPSIDAGGTMRAAGGTAQKAFAPMKVGAAAVAGTAGAIAAKGGQIAWQMQQNKADGKKNNLRNIVGGLMQQRKQAKAVNSHKGQAILNAQDNKEKYERIQALTLPKDSGKK